MMKQVLLAWGALALIALLTSGCRVVENTNRYSFTAGKDVNFNGDNVQEGTQAADKEVGDISPSTSATVTPVP